LINAKHLGNFKVQTDHDLYLLAINLTRRCNLSCAHCYLDADTLEHGTNEELRTDEVKQLLNDVARDYKKTMVVLTGGEPLLRRDLETLLEHGIKLGLFMVVGTNGVLLKPKRVASLKSAGVMGIAISIDSLDPESHDAFRGCPGAWEKSLAGIDQCKKQNIPFQIHFSVTENNAHEVLLMIDFARACKAQVLNFFFLVCTGRGETMTDISAKNYERVLHQINAAQQTEDNLLIRARCAPHFQRVVHQQQFSKIKTRVDGYDGSSCIAGTHYCRITPEGGITACPYIEESVGSLRTQSFSDIWLHASQFQSLREPRLKGKCGACEFQQLCGGCRARALAVEGDLMAADNWCSYLPQGKSIIPVLDTATNDVLWADDAQQKLERIPGFLQRMIKKRAEEYVLGLGIKTVTAEHLHTLSERRFGKNNPFKPGNQTELLEVEKVIPFSDIYNETQKHEQ